GLDGIAGDLLRSAVVPGVRVDRHHFDGRVGGEREHDRRATLERPDLDDPTPWRACRGGVEQRPPLSLRHPAADAGHGGPGLGERRHAYTANPNTTSQASPRSCSTRSFWKTSSGAAPWPCSSTSAYRNSAVSI